MEIILLILLYTFSKNPDFAQSVKPLMEQLKNSQQTLNFLNDLSKFNESFQSFKSQPQKENDGCENPSPSHEKEPENKEKPSQSPTFGIADDFIENLLENYFKKK
jgi:hypothetical protein